MFSTFICVLQTAAVVILKAAANSVKNGWLLSHTVLVCVGRPLFYCNYSSFLAVPMLFYMFFHGDTELVKNQVLSALIVTSVFVLASK